MYIVYIYIAKNCFITLLRTLSQTYANCIPINCLQKLQVNKKAKIYLKCILRCIQYHKLLYSEYSYECMFVNN